MTRDIQIDIDAFEEFLRKEKLLKRSEYIVGIRLELPIKDNDGTNVAIKVNND
jgi:hypothetical protein